MNAYKKAQLLALTGTDQQIVDQLKVLPRHRRNVYITGGPANTESVNLLHLLTARYRIMGMGSAQQWIGPLIDLEATNPTVAIVMSMLRPMLQVNDTLVYCADSDDAANMLNALESIVASITGKPEQVTADVALLSGGRIGAQFANLTMEEFQKQKADAESLEQATAEKQAAADRMTALLTTAQTLVASRATARQATIQPLLNAGIRDDEFLKNMQAQIGFATNGGGYVEITQADIDAAIGGN